jgi:hypothetical protein
MEDSLKKNLFSALSKAQGEFKSITKDRKGYNYNYADINDVLAEIRPILSKHGLFVMQMPTVIEGSNVLETLIGHLSGESIRFQTPLMIEKPNAQSYGSGVTYCRRYALVAAFGLECDDDDGSSAMQTPKRPNLPPVKSSGARPGQAPVSKKIISEAQRKRMFAIAKGVPESDVKAILKDQGYESSKDVEIHDYEIICKRLEMVAEVLEASKGLKDKPQ